MRCAVWGLPQAGILANKLLQKRLLPHGYYECANTLGLWKHIMQPISLMLVVNDFGVKYVGGEHANHLIACMKEKIQAYRGLDRGPLLWHQAQLGLQCQNP